MVLGVCGLKVGEVGVWIVRGEVRGVVVDEGHLRSVIHEPLHVALWVGFAETSPRWQRVPRHVDVGWSRRFCGSECYPVQLALWVAGAEAPAGGLEKKSQSACAGEGGREVVDNLLSEYRKRFLVHSQMDVKRWRLKTDRESSIDWETHVGQVWGVLAWADEV